jgi:GTP-binding protein
VVLNKVDTLDDELRGYLHEIFPTALQVSALTGEGVGELRDLLEERIRTLNEWECTEVAREHRVFRPTWHGMRVEKVEESAYEVSGEVAERLAQKTDWENPEGVAHFQRELERKGVVSALKKAGVEPGDEVRIGEVEFDFE